MRDAVISILVIGVILIGSFVLTNAFVRRMYYQCSKCRNLNAKRRTHCRICGEPLT